MTTIRCRFEGQKKEIRRRSNNEIVRRRRNNEIVRIQILTKSINPNGLFHYDHGKIVTGTYYNYELTIVIYS